MFMNKIKHNLPLMLKMIKRIIRLADKHKIKIQY